MPEKKQEKLLHARIQNPLLIRKTLLESAIASAEILKSMKTLKQIKSQEIKGRAELKKLMDEVKSLRDKLEEHELPSLEKVKHEKVNKVVQKKKLIHEEARKRKKQEKILGKETKVSPLDSEIETLRERIRNL